MDLRVPDADMQRTIVKEARLLQLIAEMHLSIKKTHIPAMLLAFPVTKS